MEEHTQVVSKVLVRILLSHFYASGVIGNIIDSKSIDLSSSLRGRVMPV